MTARARCSTEHTRAIIAVDLYGGFPNLVELEALATESGVHLIEDSAQAAGGWHVGRPAGSFGTTSTFSFHGSKTLTTGEGGMVLCDDDGLWERMLFLRDHGRLPGDVTFRSAEVAWKYKMSEFQAAFGRVQLDRIEELIARKRQVFDWYAERLRDAPLTLNVERRGDRNTYWMVTAVLDAKVGITSERLAEELKALNIPTRPFFWPLSSLAAYGDSPDIESSTRPQSGQLRPGPARHQPAILASADRGASRPGVQGAHTHHYRRPVRSFLLAEWRTHADRFDQPTLHQHPRCF